MAAWAAPGVLLVSTRGLRPRSALLSGVLFALLIGYGVTNWAPEAALDYFDFNRWLAWAFVASVWLVYGGIPYGLLVLAYAQMARRVPPAARGPLGAWFWVGSEVLRTNLMTGMPWELLGHTQFNNLLLIQVADMGGVYAVSFVVSLVSIATAEFTVDLRRVDLGPGPLVRRLALPAALLAAVVAYGIHSRYMDETAGGAQGYAAGAVAIVQGNTPNAFRWKRAFFEHTLARYVQLTAATHRLAPDLIIWPENAVNFYLDREPPLRAQLAAVAAMAPQGLLLGGPRVDGRNRAYNSAYLIGPGGRILGTYDKRRLVPFAEYNPLARDQSSPSAQPTAFAPGTEAVLLHTSAFNIGTVICYEVLFPHLARDLVRNGADLLVNLSNDSWMDAGDGAAPRQHFSMAVFRAIETRRYLVRAASSGASGVVSPYGRIYSVIPRKTAASTVAHVTARQGQTVYVRWGDSWVLGGILLVSLALLHRAREQSR